MKAVAVSLRLFWLMLSLVALPGGVCAGEGWESSLTVRAGVVKNRLSFGQRQGATAVEDGRYDVPALLAGPLQAGFVLAGGSYWRDLRGPGEQSWTLRIAAAAPVIELSWSALPAELHAVLLDPATGGRIDMVRVQRCLVAAGDSRELTITVEP